MVHVSEFITIERLREKFKKIEYFILTSWFSWMNPVLDAETHEEILFSILLSFALAYWAEQLWRCVSPQRWFISFEHCGGGWNGFARYQFAIFLCVLLRNSHSGFSVLV